MSTITQQPTPETDDTARKGAYLTHGEYPETCGKQIVHIDFARRLECERDEALALAKNYSERWTAECKTLRGQIEAMREAIKEVWIEIQYAESGFAGLALRVCPNDSAVESVLNRMTEALAKLQPFLP